MQRQPLTTLYKIWKAFGSQYLPGAAVFSNGLSRSFCQQGAQGAQGASVDGKCLTLKSQLRSLYKKIHPDLFHNQPAFRDTNEKSFQVLQEYLAAAQSGSGLYDHAPPHIYKFEFYIRQVQGDDVEAIDKVDVVLPPPQRARSSGGELPVATRMALGRLLEACGLSSNISGGIKGTEKVRLGDLFQEASEVQRNYSSGSLTAERHSIVVRNALRMGRGVFPSFREPLADASIDTQVAALERLIRCLDKVPHLDLGGCTMVIGKGYGVDALGNVWLDYQDEAEGWANWLPQADIQEAHDRRMAARERRGREALTANDMEVEMLYTDNRMGVSKEYSDFLTRMRLGALADGGVGAGAFFDLPVRVVRSADECAQSDTDAEKKDEGSGNKKGCVAPYHVDEHMGYVTVPVDATLKDVYEFIRKRGPEALKVRRRYRNEEQRLSEMKIHVRKKLRLRNLACDDRIGNDQFMAACARMLRHAPTLQMHMEGLYVCISDEHRLPLGRDTLPVVHLKWNFSLEDL